MTVYVDELLDYGVRIGKAGPEWCHLTADTPDELHTFAAQLGMLRHWASDHTQPLSPLHYDLTRGKRMKALKLGAVERTIAERMQMAREVTSAPEPKDEQAATASASAMSITAGQPAPLFTQGQRVRIIANAGGLYSAQIGVVGVIARKRQYRRWGYHTYDVDYCDAKGREKRVTSVREDDLEAVETVETEAPVEPTPDAPTPDAPFRIGQRVTVRLADDGMEDEYPSFTHYPIVGEIASACLVTAGGVHCYDVRFPRIERGVSTESWPPVSIREAHLLPEPSPVGWLAASAASTKKTERPLTPLPESKFSVGEHVTVDSRSDLCYETWARKGAIGEIREIGRPVRGVRRYTVRYHSPRIGVHETRIREEHLLKAEPPAPRQYATARHAYEYRAEKPRGEHLWCDAGGCFIEACAVCRAHEGDTLTATTTVTFACARGRGAVTCDHTWQVWPDGRYRHCPKCKLSERVPVAVSGVGEVTP